MHEIQERFPCYKCEKTFTTFYNMKAHSQEAHEGLVKHFPCNLCEKVFKTNSQIKNHQKYVHENVKAHECETCGQSFSTRATLRNHTTTEHFGQKNFKCDLCSKTLCREYLLRKHVLSVHTNESQNRFECAYCNDFYLTKITLKWNYVFCLNFSASVRYPHSRSRSVRRSIRTQRSADTYSDSLISYSISDQER